uniref:Uncharacterized protein n=1 Tax=Opuntia streptacantha TaxID=393608 RepID=A0A7C9DJ17_OPUST
MACRLFLLNEFFPDHSLLFVKSIPSIKLDDSRPASLRAAVTSSTELKLSPIKAGSLPFWLSVRFTSFPAQTEGFDKAVVEVLDFSPKGLESGTGISPAVAEGDD